MLLVLIYDKMLSRPQGHNAIGRILCQWKITITPAGIEPATFRFVAQHLNHCATAVTKQYMCVLIFSVTVYEPFIILKRTEWDTIKMYIGPHEQCPLFISYVNGIWIFSTDFQKIYKHKFHENPYSGSRIAPCERKDGRTARHTDRQADMKLIVAFLNTANAPKTRLVQSQ